MENVDNPRYSCNYLITTTLKVVNRFVDNSVDKSNACGTRRESAQLSDFYSYVYGTLSPVVHRLSTETFLKIFLFVLRLDGVG